MPREWARPDDENGSSVDQIFLDESCIEVALDEVEVLQDLSIEGNRRVDTLDHELVECPEHGSNRFFAGFSVYDQLPEQGIIGARDGVAGINM